MHALTRLLLMVLALAPFTACQRREPPPSENEPAAPAPALSPAKQAEQWNRLNDKLGRQREEQIDRRKQEFVDDCSLYLDILKNYYTPDAHAAVWSWITKKWAVANAGDEPGPLAWDERTSWVIRSGAAPHTITLNLGDDVTLDLVWLEPGDFWMGSPRGEPYRNSDEDQHQVVLARGFWMCPHEVTQELWRRVLRANPSYFQAAGALAPVEQVSWYDLQQFVLGLNALIEKSDEAWIGAMFRLPTEAEWEYACRADTVTPIYTGTLTAFGANNSPDLDPIAWYGGNCGVDYAGGWDSSKWIAKQYPHTAAGTHAVAQKTPNAWGLYDMIGNVWEWCADRHGPYMKTEATDPVGPATGENRVARGASWGNAAGACRAAIRNPLPPETRHNRVGFRIVASP